MNIENVKVGMKFQDLDPRQTEPRIVEVVTVGVEVLVKNTKTGRHTTINVGSLRETKSGRGWRLLP
jgi:hypothetical protein